MDLASRHPPMDTNALIDKIERCRRLAWQVNDPTTAQRLLELADEYVQRVKDCGKQTALERI